MMYNSVSVTFKRLPFQKKIKTFPLKEPIENLFDTFTYQLHNIKCHCESIHVMVYN